MSARDVILALGAAVAMTCRAAIPVVESTALDMAQLLAWIDAHGGSAQDAAAVVEMKRQQEANAYNRQKQADLEKARNHRNVPQDARHR